MKIRLYCYWPSRFQDGVDGARRGVWTLYSRICSSVNRESLDMGPGSLVAEVYSPSTGLGWGFGLLGRYLSTVWNQGDWVEHFDSN